MVEKYKEHLSKQGFDLREQIGIGLSGRTFKGFQQSLNRSVAIKFFDSELNSNNTDLKKNSLENRSYLQTCSTHQSHML